MYCRPSRFAATAVVPVPMLRFHSGTPAVAAFSCFCSSLKAFPFDFLCGIKIDLLHSK